VRGPPHGCTKGRGRYGKFALTRKRREVTERAADSFTRACAGMTSSAAKRSLRWRQRARRVTCLTLGLSILRQDVTKSAEELIDFVKTRLGSYNAPKSIAFVAELPLSPVGKVLRRQVKERYWAGRDRRV
jgi:acyl-CoA synthetase (AMP-forming)/AMP-acid ligase II